MGGRRGAAFLLGVGWGRFKREWREWEFGTNGCAPIRFILGVILKRISLKNENGWIGVSKISGQGRSV